MARMTRKGIVAINALFSICGDRRTDFLLAFQKQIDDLVQHDVANYPTSAMAEEDDGGINNSISQPSNLIQAVLGEDSEDSSTFHCHLKFEYDSIQDAQNDIKTHCIFLRKPHKIWRSFETSSNSFTSPPESYAWVVAPSIDIESPTPVAFLPNPKSLLVEGQQQKIQALCCCVNANLCIQPDHREEFLNVLENARVKSIQEPCCLEYQFGKSLTTKNTFHVHQEYIGDNEGQDGLDKHCQTKHYQRWKDFASKKPFTKSPVGYVFKTSLDTSNDSWNRTGTSQCHHKGVPLPQNSRRVTAENEVVILDGGNGHELNKEE